jgi:hypothetical protein
MVFAKREGGAVEADNGRSFPGGMTQQVASGAPSTVADVTLTGQFVPARDHEFMRWLKGRAGKGDCAVSEQLLDVDGNAFGRPDTWTGVLGNVDSGEYDASSSDPREFSLVVTADGVA